MTDVRFGSIMRLTTVSDILRAVEDTEGQASEEAARREKTRDRAQRKACTACE